MQSSPKAEPFKQWLAIFASRQKKNLSQLEACGRFVFNLYVTGVAKAVPDQFAK